MPLSSINKGSVAHTWSSCMPESFVPACLKGTEHIWLEWGYCVLIVSVYCPSCLSPPPPHSPHQVHTFHQMLRAHTVWALVSPRTSPCPHVTARFEYCCFPVSGFGICITSWVLWSSFCMVANDNNDDANFIFTSYCCYHKLAKLSGLSVPQIILVF